MSTVPLDPTQWALAETVADARKERRRYYAGKDGHSTDREELAAVAAEIVIGILLGFAPERIDADLRSADLSPGWQWQTPAHTYRVHAVEDGTHRYLIEKVERAEADLYCHSDVDLGQRLVHFRGWTTRDRLLLADQRDERGFGLSYWMPARYLNPPATLPGLGGSPTQGALW